MSCPPTSHTVNEMFLYSTVSTLKPIVGIVVTISPSFSLYKMVVLPAASRPTYSIESSFASVSNSILSRFITQETPPNVPFQEPSVERQRNTERIHPNAIDRPSSVAHAARDDASTTKTS